MTRTLFPPTILPSAVNNRCNYNISTRYNNGNSINNTNSYNNTSNLRSLGQSRYLSPNTKNTVNRMNGVSNLNSGIVGENKGTNNVINKHATHLTRQGKRED